MAYKKQTWVDGVTPLDAAHLNHMEQGISQLSEEIANLPSGGTGLTSAEKTAMLTLFKAAAYTANVSGTITSLETLWGGGGESGGGETETTYSVTNNLTNVTTTNAATTIAQGAIYAASLSAQSGYDLSDVTITMGGEDVTALYYADGAISIPSVTGDIVVTATATISAGTDWNIIYCLNGSDPTDKSNSADRLVRIDTSNRNFWLVASFIKSGAQPWVQEMYFRKADGSKLGSIDIRNGYSEVSKYKIGSIEFWVCKYDISNIINYMNDNSISSLYGDIRDPRIVPNINTYPYVFAAQTEITEAMLRAITGLE